MKFHFRSLPLYLLCAVFLSSCKKEKIELLTQEVNSNTGYDLYDVVFVNDSLGYACGGSKWTIGIELRTNDGGKTWSKPDSLFSVCAYSIHFHSPLNGIIAGNVSFISSTSDSFHSFTNSQTNYKAINDIEFFKNQKGVKVGGDGYQNGYISYTADAGNTWQNRDLPNSMTAVCYADSNTVFASGYGVIYRSTNGGAEFKPLDIRGDFYVASDFPTATTGYFAGYQGEILKTENAGNIFITVMSGNKPFSSRDHFRVIKFWDENTGYVAGDGGLMYRTVNGGDSWQLAEQFTEVNLRGMYLFSANSGIVVGDGGKMFLFQH